MSTASTFPGGSRCSCTCPAQWHRQYHTMNKKTQTKFVTSWFFAGCIAVFLFVFMGYDVCFGMTFRGWTAVSCQQSVVSSQSSGGECSADTKRRPPRRPGWKLWPQRSNGEPAAFRSCTGTALTVVGNWLLRNP